MIATTSPSTNLLAASILAHARRQSCHCGLGQGDPNLLLSKNNYTVTFQSNGGSDVASQEVEYEGLADIPADPVREGYTFTGWYEDLGFKLSNEEVAELEEAENLYDIELTDLLWQTDKTTLIRYDLKNEPVYYDLELQARWDEKKGETKTASTTATKQTSASTTQPSASSAQSRRTSTPTTSDTSPNVMVLAVAGAVAIVAAATRFAAKH